MTFSLVASDGAGHWGVAVASKFLAVGAVVPAAEVGAGAIATQAMANLRYRPDGLALLAAGRSAADTVAALVAADDGREDRQLGIVDADGGSATYTGQGCFPWAGGATGPGWAAQGNILTGPEVIDAMVAAWLGTETSAPLARRLHAALLAGDLAGGDSRGRQSAAILVVCEGGGYGGGSDVLVDLRVDDHVDPVADLGRLLDIHDLLFGRPDPDDCLPLTSDLQAEVAALLATVGHPVASDDLGSALAGWAGVENLEERMVAGAIDPLVLAHLRSAAERGGATA